MDVDLPNIHTSQMPVSSSGKKQVDKTPNLVSIPTNASAHKSSGKKSKSANDQYPKKIITVTRRYYEPTYSLGNPLSMNIKGQRKYQTVCLRIALNSFTVASFDSRSWTYTLGFTLVHWFPRAWILKQRKVREKFVLALRNIPEEMYKQQLWDRTNSHTFLKSQNVKSFKLIQTNKGERLLLGYFKKYDDYVKALYDLFTLNNTEY
ncbi:hypothetical protein RclHR1_04060005 [Rhizophagus clarus]|nr:hypothetical protein RclHR1_04060005 [Rhizophagus clarus]